MALVAALAACAEEEPALPAEETEVVPEAAPVAERVVPDGSPMPSAEISGVPPYPGAVVWRLSPRRVTEFDAIEAFTSDSFANVVAFYDERMGEPWRREEFGDAVTYTLDPDMGAIMLSPWDGRELPDDAPQPLRDSRTGIGVSWRKAEFRDAPADTLSGT